MAMVMIRFVAMLHSSLALVFQSQNGIQLCNHINGSWTCQIEKGAYRLAIPLSVLILRSV